MNMLALDDPRWAGLDHRGWTNGVRSHDDPSAPDVASELRALTARPDLKRFQALWPYLCSEGTAWAAAYAAVPYIVEIAKQVDPRERVEYLYVVGLIRMSEAFDSGESFALQSDLEAGYRGALPVALALAADLLTNEHDAATTRLLLAAVAALKGHVDLAQALDDLQTF